jgi:mono/diheme cytochrome c family protein
VNLRFGLVLILVFASGCSGPERIEAPRGTKPHLGDEWFPYRAGLLGIDEKAARARDQALPEDKPLAPEAIDQPLAIEASAIYRTACATCHGRDGTPPEPREGERAPRAWGTSGTRMGFTMGGDKMRAGIYRTIQKGGEPKDGKASNMPAWNGTLSREQTWALVRYLESL